MPGWHIHAVTEDVAVRVVRPMPDLAASLDAAIEAVWQSEQLRLGGVLFNGRVFTADEITPTLIRGHWTEFRRVVAQMRRPELHPQLRIRSLAVGGVITCPDGVLFGRRPERSVYQAGEWQLPPAGSVDGGAERAEGRVDVAAMLLEELAEELGLTADQVSPPVPVAIVEHPASHVLDLGMAMRTELGTDEIFRIHRAKGNGEYDPLVVVAQAALEEFLARNRVTHQAPIFLQKLGLVRADI